MMVGSQLVIEVVMSSVQKPTGTVAKNAIAIIVMKNAICLSFVFRENFIFIFSFSKQYRNMLISTTMKC